MALDRSEVRPDWINEVDAIASTDVSQKRWGVQEMIGATQHSAGFRGFDASNLACILPQHN